MLHFFPTRPLFDLTALLGAAAVACLLAAASRAPRAVWIQIDASMGSSRSSAS